MSALAGLGGAGCQVGGYNALTNWYALSIANTPANAKNSLGMFAAYSQTAQCRVEKRRNTACQWFATKWRARAAEIGVQAAARLMRKQGIPCEVTVSLLATR